MGGILKRLVMDGDVAQTELIGPPNPIVRQQIAGASRARARTLSERDRKQIAELEAQEDVRAAAHDPLEPRGEDRDGRDRRRDDPARSRQDEPLDRPRVPHQLPRPRARHGADAADERGQRAAALRLAGQLEAGQSAGADVVPGVVRRRPVQARSATTGRSGWAEATWPLNEGRMDEKTFMDDPDKRASTIAPR